MFEWVEKMQISLAVSWNLNQMVLKIKHCVFIVVYFSKHNSWKTYTEMFLEDIKNGSTLVKPPKKSNIQNSGTKWYEMSFVLNKKRNYPKTIQIPENIADVNDMLFKSHANLRDLHMQVKIKISLSQNIIKKESILTSFLLFIR